MRSVSFDRGRWRNQIARLHNRFRKNTEELNALLREETREAARITAGYLARLTFPNRYGVHLLKLAITADLRNAYATASALYADLERRHGKSIAAAFYAAFSRRDYPAARSILNRLGHPWAAVPMGNLDPSLHNPARDAKGRIRLEIPLQIIPNEDLHSYLPIALRRMGKTASGWSACALILGGEEHIPHFKSTAVHGTAGGAVETIQTATRTVVVLHNLRPLAKRHLSPGLSRQAVAMGRDYLAYAIRHRRRKN
jgi:hypothetical protein